MLNFNCNNVSTHVIGEFDGLNLEDLYSQYENKISDIILDLNLRKDKPGQWLQWMNSGYNEETVWYVKEYAAMVEGRFDNVVVIGMGGSTLGSMAFCEALLKPYWNILSKEDRDNNPRIFFINNIDPDQTSALLDTLDLKKTLVNVITKSGSTIGTMAQFMVIKEKMQEALGDDYRKNIVTTTDKQSGALRQIANEEGYKTFYVPDDIPGRFSVFSAVGLLPMALVGIDIDEIIKGVKVMDLTLKNTDIRKNVAAQNALIHFALDTQKKKHISVMMPYSNRLRHLCDWYVQLWAESLGKKYDRAGHEIYNAPTPIKAEGVTDQHSLMQLLIEGRNDKVVTFVRIQEFENNVEIPAIFEYTPVSYLGSKSLNRLMDAEANTTMALLNDASRPNITISIDKITPEVLAKLFYMLEMQTAIIAELYNIDAFNQPGVEEGKNYTYALMDRAGYEESAQMLREKLNI